MTIEVIENAVNISILCPYFNALEGVSGSMSFYRGMHDDFSLNISKI